MATKSFIQGKINTNLADASDILPEEHREVEDLLLNEHFPDLITVEWDGTAPVDPITDVICNPALTTQAKVAFTCRFWKNGNTVYFNGELENISTSAAISGVNLITFQTTLYKPLLTSSGVSSLIGLNVGTPTELEAKIVYSSGGIAIFGTIPVNPLAFKFSGVYKVAN